MDADWWARGTAIAALFLSLIAAGWRGFEWWEGRRVRLNVTASMAQFWPAMHPAQFVVADDLKREGYLLHLRVLNKGRPITIDSGTGLAPVGLLDKHSGKLHGFVPHPEQFPARLQPLEALDVFGSPGKELVEALKSGAKMIPYCKDSEGDIHNGKYDRHFHEEAQRLIAEYPEMNE